MALKPTRPVLKFKRHPLPNELVISHPYRIIILKFNNLVDAYDNLLELANFDYNLLISLPLLPVNFQPHQLLCFCPVDRLGHLHRRRICPWTTLTS